MASEVDGGRRREHELWRRWGRERDLRAREELVALYLPVARRMARRYAGVAEPYDDLLQVASLGLLNAVDRFDPSRGAPFLGFAKPTILGELKRHFRDRVWTVRLPRSLHDLILRIERLTGEMSIDLGRSPTVDELAARLGVDPAEVLEALAAQHDRSALSLDGTPHADQEDDEREPGWLGTEEEGYRRVEDRVLLRSVLPEAGDRGVEVLRLRFVEDLPQTKIAERLGCSQMQISRLLHRTLDDLRAGIEG